MKAHPPGVADESHGRGGARFGQPEWPVNNLMEKQIGAVVNYTGGLYREVNGVFLILLGGFQCGGLRLIKFQFNKITPVKNSSLNIYFIYFIFCYRIF